MKNEESKMMVGEAAGTIESSLDFDSVSVTEAVLTSIKPKEVTPEYVKSQIVHLFKYLMIMMVAMGKRNSIRGLWTSLTNIPMPKATGTELREELKVLEFKAGANGSIPIFADIDQYRGLVYFGVFNDDCSAYCIPKLDESVMNPTELDMYKHARGQFLALPKESAWEKRVQELGLEIPDRFEDMCITGDPIDRLEDMKIVIPEVTNFLPENVHLIEFRGSPYLYVTTRCALQLTLESIILMQIDIVPTFYQTFNGGTFSGDESFRPCEDLPEGAYFEHFPDHEMALAITTTEAYISLIEKGIYQRYNTIEKWKDYSIHINHSFLPHIIESPTMDEIIKALESYILPALLTLRDVELLEYIKKDLLKVITVDAEEIIVTALDERLGQLNSVA